MSIYVILCLLMSKNVNNTYSKTVKNRFLSQKMACICKNRFIFAWFLHRLSQELDFSRSLNSKLIQTKLRIKNAKLQNRP